MRRGSNGLIMFCVVSLREMVMKVVKLVREFVILFRFGSDTEQWKNERLNEIVLCFLAIHFIKSF